MEFTQARPGILTTSLDQESATATVVVGSQRCLLVDTGSSPSQGAEIRQAVERATDRPLGTVVVTHGHWDHSFGLPAFDGLDTLGHENIAHDLHCSENLRWAANLGIDPADLGQPHDLMALIAVRNLGGTSVEIAHFGPAHTRSDLVVAVPDRSVIIVGDLVEPEGPPQFDETSSLDGWVRSLDALYGLLTPDTLVIPGHGSPVGPWEVAHFRTGLAAIWDQSEWAFHQGIPQAEVYESDDLQWPWDRATVERGIETAYRELTARTG